MKLDNMGCIKLWSSDLREDRSSQYKYDQRKHHIKDLMTMFMDHEVSLDDAEMMKKYVVEALVHKNGLKVTKKEYTGWKENVEQDFDDAIQQTYIKPNVTSIKPLKGSQEYDPRIVNWCKSRFGENIGNELIRAAHQPLHLYWMMCINESFKRNTGGRL